MLYESLTESVTEIYKIGSMEPGAMLVEASKAFQVNIGPTI